MTEQNFFIGQIFEGQYPPAAAVWCNNNRAYIDVIGTRKYVIKAVPEPPVPTREDIEHARAARYTAEADPITAHIQRLRDAEQTDEVVDKIAALQEQRDAIVAQIKESLPYPED